MSPDELLGLGFSKELVVIIISALPIFELRGALPLAINLFGLPWYYAFLLAVTGNLLPVPFLLLFLNGFLRLLNRVSVLRPWLTRLSERTRQRGKIAEKYQRIGLMLFVAVPLPATGAWTGSLVAVLFGLSFRQSLLSIFAGIIIAGIIVTCLSLLGWAGAIIAGIGLAGLITFRLWKS